jgi:GTP-binding protein
MFVAPIERVYAGQIVGENARPGDLICNPAKRKVQTNHRASTKTQTVPLDVPRKMTLDEALEWIEPDELIEVTPRSIRLRKAILCAQQRRRARRLHVVIEK